MNEIERKHPTPEQYLALARFHDKHGRNWKQKLNLAWSNGTDANEPDGALLRQVRNQFGPEWLAKWNGEVKLDPPQPGMLTPQMTLKKLNNPIEDVVRNLDEVGDPIRRKADDVREKIRQVSLATEALRLAERELEQSREGLLSLVRRNWVDSEIETADVATTRNRGCEQSDGLPQPAAAASPRPKM